MTNETPGPPLIAAAAALLREDGQLLLVRHRADDVEFGGRWSLPMQAVPDEEDAEGTLLHVLRERLHVQPGPFEFAETIYLSGAARSRYVVNVFTCVEWGGEPRYSEQHYDDAAWVQPTAHPPLDLLPGVSAWLRDAFGGAASALTDAGTLASSLEEARRELLEAYESIATDLREQPRHDGWSPLDVLSHVASVETYYAAEARRLLETPGRSWRGFNPAQWEDDHRSRPTETETEARSRLDGARRRTLDWLGPLSEEQLALYGNHPERGAVTIGDRVDKIGRHDREHIEQLRELARDAGRRSNSAAALGEQNAAADR